MSPSGPGVVAGHVYQSDGTTAQANAIVYVFNKTNDETKSGYDTKFIELKTNAQGEYSCNTGNFDTAWNTDDEIKISAFYEDTAQETSFTWTGTPVSDKDMTLRNLEPSIAVMKLLRMKMTDPNSTDRPTNTQMVKPKYPRPTAGEKSISKDNYPIITVVDIDEDSVDAGITSNKAEETTTTLLITIYIWANSVEEQILTIDGVKYEGTKLRDYLGRNASNVLRKEFHLKPAYNQNGIIRKFYDYEKLRMESMEFDPERDHGIMKKEIEIQIKNINQEV
jgi:hypothetical protein